MSSRRIYMTSTMNVGHISCHCDGMMSLIVVYLDAKSSALMCSSSVIDGQNSQMNECEFLQTQKETFTAQPITD